ncbi:MAG: hypothetical protein AAF614_06595 [Chloroflexota bacterium]
MTQTYEEKREEQLELQLEQLRRAIMQAEPSVIYDGRFEKMVLNPNIIIDIARDLIEHQLSERAYAD